jgi:hypothetical protein
MANKKCNKCGNEIINESLVCPACKTPVKKNISTGKGCLIIIAAVIFIPLIFSKIVGVDSGSASSRGNESGYQFGANDLSNHFMAYSIMEEYVKQRLKSPSSAEFPESRERKNHIKHLGNRKYHINSWVDSDNGFGASIRTKFVGEIKQTSQYEWKLTSLILSP